MSLMTNEYEVVASLCRESYYDFLKEFWHEISPEEPHWNWHIELICEELQDIAERVFRGLPKKHDLIINISPGTTKSSAASIAYLPWLWTRMPTLRSINGSHTHELVQDLSRKARNIVQSELYQNCFPEVVLSEDQNTKGYFMNTAMGARFSCTISGKTPTGMHAHIHVVDDPIDPKKAISDAEINSANAWMSETLSTRKIDKAVTPLVLIMQRLAQDDPTGYLLRRGRIRHICLPAEETPDINPAELREKYINGLMDPKRLSQKVLDEFKQEGDYFYSGQFLQNPIPLGGGMFKTDRLNFVDSAPDKRQFKKIIRYWDNAGSPKKGDRKRAYTCGVKMGVDIFGRFFIMDVKRVRLDSAAREMLKNSTAHSDTREIEIIQEQEGGSGGQESAENTLRRTLVGFHVKVDIPKGDKTLRADPFSSQVNIGNVYLVKAPWNKDYVEEMKHFPHSTYKDQIDASSGAFANLVKRRMRLKVF